MNNLMYMVLMTAGLGYQGASLGQGKRAGYNLRGFGRTRSGRRERSQFRACENRRRCKL